MQMMRQTEPSPVSSMTFKLKVCVNVLDFVSLCLHVLVIYLLVYNYVC